MKLIRLFKIFGFKAVFSVDDLVKFYNPKHPEWGHVIYTLQELAEYD